MFNTSCLLLSGGKRRPVSPLLNQTDLTVHDGERGVPPRIARNGTGCIVRGNASGDDFVKKRTKNYRRKELSGISPSVIDGLSDSGEQLVSVGSWA